MRKQERIKRMGELRVNLNEELSTKLENKAKRIGKSKSDIVRDALNIYLDKKLSAYLLAHEKGAAGIVEDNEKLKRENEELQYLLADFEQRYKSISQKLYLLEREYTIVNKHYQKLRGIYTEIEEENKRLKTYLRNHEDCLQNYKECKKALKDLETKQKEYEMILTIIIYAGITFAGVILLFKILSYFHILL